MTSDVKRFGTKLESLTTFPFLSVLTLVPLQKLGAKIVSWACLSIELVGPLALVDPQPVKVAAWLFRWLPSSVAFLGVQILSMASLKSNSDSKTMIAIS